MSDPKPQDATDEFLATEAQLSWNTYMHELSRRYRAALAISSAARKAGLVDEQGNFRKILGTLPITKDGYVVGHKGKTYIPCNDGTIHTCTTDHGDNMGPWNRYGNERTARLIAEAAKRGDDA